MSNFKKLMDLGAESVGGDLIWKHKVLGQFRDGDLILTDAGLDALKIDDVVVTDIPAVKPKTSRARRPAALLGEDPAVAYAAESDPELEIDLSDLKLD